VLKEMLAAGEADARAAVRNFDEAMFGHIRFVLANLARTFILGMTGSHFVQVHADIAPETRRYYQQLTRFSAALAFLADISMGALGGALKRKEKLSARLGDVLSMLYLCSATLRRYEAEGRQQADAPLMHWAIWDAMFKAQSALEGVISNFPNRALAALMRAIVFPLGRPYVVPADRLGGEVARLLIEPSATRDRLTAGMFLGRGGNDPIQQIERALIATIASEPIDLRIRTAVRDGRLNVQLPPGAGPEALIARAREEGIIDGEEALLLANQRRWVAEVIRVDDFDTDLGSSLLQPADPVTRQSTAALAPRSSADQRAAA
jgi:acyl-CoA dehydrogenase